MTLRIAQAIKDELLRSGRVRVALTRGDDRYLILQERYGVARKLGADLFISIHCDSVGEGNATGASVYTLSEKGEGRVGKVLGKDDWLLNASLTGGDRGVGQILLDLSQRATKNRSAVFAEMLVDECAVPKVS